MIALILILILIGITIFTALLESFYTPEDLSKMGIRLDYSLTGRPSDRPTGNPPGKRPRRPGPGQEIPTHPRSQAT